MSYDPDQQLGDEAAGVEKYRMISMLYKPTSADPKIPQSNMVPAALHLTVTLIGREEPSIGSRYPNTVMNKAIPHTAAVSSSAPSSVPCSSQYA
eukprot:CAMPEP_0182530444 /NCGR_PEP_ID=MMETSP1323-20130603/5918_1 /TAXON_ID=236787 /ORGANISM="Florenciella parvula, Strain RCC1693" /LENGTH=93 /DNA_ID=CAMNT_0024739743 /DNA_START=72 /DNA_END=350 /DNA_ORIENTATION=+